MSKKTLSAPVILAMKAGEIHTTLLDRIKIVNGVPADHEIRPQVHTIGHTKSTREFMSSKPGIIITLEEAMECLTLAADGGVTEAELKVIKSSPKDFNFAYIRTRSKDGKSTFGNLYVSSGEIAHWEYKAA